MWAYANEIIDNECRRHMIPRGLLLSRSRLQHVSQLRKIVVGRLRKEAGLSWAEIGFLMKRNPRNFRGGERPVPS